MSPVSNIGPPLVSTRCPMMPRISQKYRRRHVQLALMILTQAIVSTPCSCWAPTSSFGASRATAPKFRRTTTKSTHPAHRKPSQRIKSSPTGLHSNPNQFDISKPTFDLFSLRLIRSDALLRYNSLNQSEPLRINLSLFSTITLLTFPYWSESVTGELPTSYSGVAAIFAGMGCASLFWRERTRRSIRLRRIEKELNAERLEVRLPVSSAISSVRPRVRLGELKGKRRILAIRGSREQWRTEGVWDLMCVLRRRLVQSQTLVVLVPTDSSTREDWGLDARIGDALWLGDASHPDRESAWLDYFSELVDNSEDQLAWFALNFNGRAIASGLGDPPRLLELLGQHCQPCDVLDTSDPAEPLEGSYVLVGEQILGRQREFYAVLTNSEDEADMQRVYAKEWTSEVDEVLAGGGRIDDWTKCLEPEARPLNMVISGSDVWVASDSRAYSTCVEHPSNAGVEGATLLAVQRWIKENDESGGDEEWKLDLHQTIPWSTGLKAGGTLRCDCRGCVALTRAR